MGIKYDPTTPLPCMNYVIRRNESISDIKMKKRKTNPQINPQIKI